MTTIGENIKCIRLEKGLTQKDLAASCGLSSWTIKQIECGKLTPKFGYITKFSDILGVTIIDLVKDTWMENIFTEGK